MERVKQEIRNDSWLNNKYGACSEQLLKPQSPASPSPKTTQQTESATRPTSAAPHPTTTKATPGTTTQRTTTSRTTTAGTTTATPKPTKEPAPADSSGTSQSTGSSESQKRLATILGIVFGVVGLLAGIGGYVLILRGFI